MPPIPTHQPPAQTHLTTLTSTLKTTSAQITRLSTLSFQPGSEPLDVNEADTHSVRAELSQDIRESLAQLDEEFELLKTEVEEDGAWEDGRGSGYLARGGRLTGERRGGRKEEFKASVDKFGEDLQAARKAFRGAQVKAKRAAESAKTREREAVFAGLRQQGTENGDADGDSGAAAGGLFANRRAQQSGKSKLSKDEQLVQSSSDVTTSLRRTHDLLATELSRSRFAQETFEASTQALQGLGERYEGLESVLGKSRELLGTLLRSQKSDTWYLETAFYILLATLCWLVFRRVLFGPFVRLPLFLWSVVWFLVRWVVLKPLVGFLWATGVYTTEPIGSAGQGRGGLREVTTTRKPLIVQNSASAKPPVYTGSMAEQARSRGVPAGAGGAGAKVGKEDVLGGSVSEGIGRMAEESDKQGKGEGGEEPVRRGDGTVLEERGDVPRNPKKKVFEEEASGQGKGEEVKEGEGQARRKRDEL